MPAAMPMAVTPAVMAMPMPVPVMAPAHLFRFEPIDVRLRNDRGLGAIAIGRLRHCNRRQWRGLCACSERGTACHKSNGEFQKIPAFHNSDPCFCERRKQCRSFKMNAG